MIKSIRLLRASTSEWKSQNPIIPDGEPAIEKTENGNIRLKIGNGSDTFDALPSLLGDTVESAETAITLSHAKSYRLKTIAELVVSLPDNVDDDFYSEISFDSGKDATEFYTTTHIRFTGDGVADEDFMPDSNTHYTVFIWYDGDFQGIVRGLPNA